MVHALRVSPAPLGPVRRPNSTHHHGSDNAWYHNRLGVCLDDGGHDDQAMTEYQESIRSTPLGGRTTIWP